MIRRGLRAIPATALLLVGCAGDAGLDVTGQRLARVETTETATGPCGRVELVNFQPEHAAAAREALAEACDVLVSRAFRDGVAGRNWTDRCWTNPFARPRQVEGAEVYRSLMAAGADFQLVEEKTRNAVATTSLALKRIKIQPERFEGWLSNDRGRRAALINTLVHERTHLVPYPGTTATFRYTDRGHLLPWCADGRLVSYGLGDLAEQAWLAGG